MDRIPLQEEKLFSQTAVIGWRWGYAPEDVQDLLPTSIGIS
jgi:hypothetical protein